jgi:biotin transport system substrate-specific component
MSTASVRSSGIVLADLLPGTLVRDTVLVLGGAGLTGAAAQASFHTSLSPVPITLQTMSVLVVGASLGSVRGLLSLALYMVAGGLGVPWFASQGHGWGGPSFGYVIGFIAAAGIVGELARRGNDRSFLSAIGVMAIGEAVLLTIGTIWLANDLHVSASKAISYGVTPFLTGDLIKLGLAALIFPAAWKLARR